MVDPADDAPSPADQARTIRYPVYVSDRLDQVWTVRRRLAAELGRRPSLTELATALGSAPDDVRRLHALPRVVVDLRHLEAVERAGHPLPRQLVDTSADRWHDDLHRQELVWLLLACLCPREREILLLRFGFVDGERWTLERIRPRYGVTRERIRQLERKALDRLSELVNPPIDAPGHTA